MLSQSNVQEVLAAVLSFGCDFAEIFVEDRFVINKVLQSGQFLSS